MRSFVAMCAVVFVLAAAALAGPIELGTGEHLANLVVNFKDGANYWFSVPFSPGETAENAWLRADELSSLELAYDRYDFGVFINGIAYDGHSNSGYQGGEDWWHQWQRGSAENNWVSGMGISADTLTDGCWDALVYGSANPPEVPEPCTMVLLAVVGAGVLAARRRASQPCWDGQGGRG